MKLDCALSEINMNYLRRDPKLSLNQGVNASLCCLMAACCAALVEEERSFGLYLQMDSQSVFSPVCAVLNEGK